MRCGGSLRKPSTGCCPHQTHSNLSGNSVLSLKRKAVTLSSSQGTDASGSSDMSVLAFWFFHCTPPSSVQGHASLKICVCDPGTQTASHINLPGPPADRLSAAPLLLPQLGYSHTSDRHRPLEMERWRLTLSIHLCLSLYRPSQALLQSGIVMSPKVATIGRVIVQYLSPFSAAVGGGRRLNTFINSRPVVLEQWFSACGSRPIWLTDPSVWVT